MSLNKIITSAVLSASIAAGSLIPFATAANARDWNRDGDGRSPRVERFQPRDSGRDNRWNNQRDVRGGYGRDFADNGYRRHKDRTGRNIAIGAFAAILGLAIASQAGRANHYDSYRD